MNHILSNIHFSFRRNLNVVDYSKSTTRRLFDGLLAAEEVKSATTNINTERYNINLK